MGTWTTYRGTPILPRSARWINQPIAHALAKTSAEMPANNFMVLVRHSPLSWYKMPKSKQRDGREKKKKKKTKKKVIVNGF